MRELILFLNIIFLSFSLQASPPSCEIVLSPQVISDRLVEYFDHHANNDLVEWVRRYKNDTNHPPRILSESDVFVTRTQRIADFLGSALSQEVARVERTNRLLSELQSGDQILLENGETITLGKFLGFGTTTHIFEVVEQPHWVIRLPHMSLRSIPKWLSRYTASMIFYNGFYRAMDFGIKMKIPVLDTKRVGKFVFTQRVHPFQSLRDFLLKPDKTNSEDQVKINAVVHLVEQLTGRRALGDVASKQIVWVESKMAWQIADANSISSYSGRPGELQVEYSYLLEELKASSEVWKAIEKKMGKLRMTGPT